MNKELIYLAEQEILKLPAKLDYKLVLLKNHEDNIVLRDGKVEKMLRATSFSLAINLYLDGRDGFFYTNDLRPESVSAFIKTAFETTRLLEPDVTRTLADPDRYYRGDGPDLLNFDASLSEMTPDEKLLLMRETAAEVEGTDRRIISLQTRYTDRQHEAHYLISNGFDACEQSSYCTLTSIVTVEGEGGQHPMDGWGESNYTYTLGCYAYTMVPDPVTVEYARSLAISVASGEILTQDQIRENAPVHEKLPPSARG